MNVDRYIAFYDKITEQLIGEIRINEIELSDLLNLISKKNYKDDELLYGCYLLEKEQLDMLFSIAHNKIEYQLDKYEYFLEATAK